MQIRVFFNKPATLVHSPNTRVVVVLFPSDASFPQRAKRFAFINCQIITITEGLGAAA
jgi:hypothetical protein